MSSRVKMLKERGMGSPPRWLPDNIMYEVMMGSVAYGVSNAGSDIDVYGFAIPPKHMIFPESFGFINGFDKNIPNFEQWQEHHLIDPGSGKEYDFSIYGIVKYFRLCMENNPNMIDSLFVPRRCVLHSTKVGEMMREARKSFLHKGSWHKFKGYAFSQVSKMKTKSIGGLDELLNFEKEFGIDHSLTLPDAENILLNAGLNERFPTYPQLENYVKLFRKCVKKSCRTEMVKSNGFDVKFVYHVVRLLDEVEQIMTEGDIDLQRNREQLKSIRRGDWTMEQIIEHFERKEKDLETLYTNSSLPHGPDVELIKQLLIDCLEEHYGNLEVAVNRDDKKLKLLEEIMENTGKLITMESR